MKETLFAKSIAALVRAIENDIANKVDIVSISRKELIEKHMDASVLTYTQMTWLVETLDKTITTLTENGRFSSFSTYFMINLSNRSRMECSNNS